MQYIKVKKLKFIIYTFLVFKIARDGNGKMTETLDEKNENLT